VQWGGVKYKYFNLLQCRRSEYVVQTFSSDMGSYSSCTSFTHFHLLCSRLPILGPRGTVRTGHSQCWTAAIGICVTLTGMYHRSSSLCDVTAAAAAAAAAVEIDINDDRLLPCRRAAAETD